MDVDIVAPGNLANKHSSPSAYSSPRQPIKQHFRMLDHFRMIDYVTTHVINFILKKT